MKNTIICFTMVSFLFLGMSCVSVDEKSETFIADFDPFILDNSSISLQKALTANVDEKNVEVTFIPRDGRVMLLFRDFVGAQYNLYLDEDARAFFESSFDQYSSAFEAHTLDERKRITWDIYGMENAYMEWGLLQLSEESSFEFILGYRFIKDTPYFMMTVPELVGDVNQPDRKMEGFSIFFSRSQALALLDIISNSELEPVIEELKLMQEDIDSKTSGVDEY